MKDQRFRSNLRRWAAAGTTAVACLGLSTTAMANRLCEEAHGGHGGGHGHEHVQHCDGPLQPILSVADFNGDGIVDDADIQAIEARVAAGDYIAFFDRNADEALDGDDVAAATAEVGQTSTPLDQQIAEVFANTERYRNLGVAMAEGWMPFTGSLEGHGIHWTNYLDGRLDGNFEFNRPEGLNYSESGELWAVFFAKADLVNSGDYHPAGFDGPEPWHHHAQACFNGILGTGNPDNPFDHTAVNFDQCVPQEECQAPLWSPKFWMLHLWLYKLNPCGMFAGTHQAITEGSSEPGRECNEAVHPGGTMACFNTSSINVRYNGNRWGYKSGHLTAEGTFQLNPHTEHMVTGILSHGAKLQVGNVMVEVPRDGFEDKGNYWYQHNHQDDDVSWTLVVSGLSGKWWLKYWDTRQDLITSTDTQVTLVLGHSTGDEIAQLSHVPQGLMDRAGFAGSANDVCVPRTCHH